MGNTTHDDITRFSEVIPDPETGHAWLLRANHARGDMEYECVRCGRVEELVSIEDWRRCRVPWIIINHRAAWVTVKDSCPKAGAPMPALDLEKGPLVAVYGANERCRLLHQRREEDLPGE